MMSIRAALAQFYLRNSKYKKIFSGEGGAESAMDKLHAIPAALPSASMRKKFTVDEDEFMGQPVYTISPKNGSNSNANIQSILYLHGGGYVGAISAFHWVFIGQLVKNLGVKVIVPFYPRAPKHNVDANYDMMLPFYDDLVTKFNPENMAVMGDSAGAGLSLSLTQQLIAAGKAAPAKVVLLSPWLDASQVDPRQVEIEKKDCILGIKGLEGAGQAYAGPNPTSDPRVSPGLASLKNLPPIAMFAGTYDILLTNAHDFKERIDADGSVSLSYFEYDKMHHVWMLLPCPETKQTLDEIASFLR